MKQLAIGRKVFSNRYGTGSIHSIDQVIRIKYTSGHLEQYNDVGQNLNGLKEKVRVIKIGFN